MIALYSFGVTVHREMGREQFLAFYAVAAVAASLLSHVASVLPLLLLSGGAATSAAATCGSCAHLYPKPMSSDPSST